MTDFAVGAARVLLLAAVVFSVVFHGAVEAWSVSILATLIVASAFLLTAGFAISGCGELKLPATVWPVAAFLALVLVQQLGRANAAGEITTLSVDREATANAAFVLLFLLVAHLLAATFWHDAGGRARFAGFLTIVGALLALLSIIQGVSGNGLFFWYRETMLGSGRGGWLTGPFVNHNHLAGYLELIAPTALSIAAAAEIRRGKTLYGLAFVLMAAAIILSASRGGMIGLAAGGFVVLAARMLARRSLRGERPPTRTGLVFAIGTVAAATGFLIWLGLDPAIERFADTKALGAESATAQTFEDSRGWIWRNSWPMFAANPVTGVGVGAYLTAFPIYATSDGVREFGSKYLIDRAHNDYLQILTDAGLAGAAIAVWFLILTISATRRALIAALTEPAAAGMAGGIVAMLVHSFFDFNLQLPSTSLLFLIIVAVVAIRERD